MIFDLDYPTDLLGVIAFPDALFVDAMPTGPPGEVVGIQGTAGADSQFLTGSIQT
jgi:hypothetical protein